MRTQTVSFDTLNLPLPPGAVATNRGIIIDDIEFVVDFSGAFASLPSSATCFVLGKTPEMITTYYQIGQKTAIRNMVDLGIYKGGSAAFFDCLYRPDRLVAVDIMQARVEALDLYIRSRDKRVVHPHYGYDQADRPRLQRLIEAEFQNSEVDLVVDDASHEFARTRASFNILFPYLRTGGLYVIEDWGWAHWDGWSHLPAEYQKNGALFPQEPAVTNFIFELVMASATSPELIASIRITLNMAIVEKGPDKADPLAFDIGNCYMARGYKWHPIL